MTRPLPRLAALAVSAALALTGCHDGTNPLTPVAAADSVAVPSFTGPATPAAIPDTDASAAVGAPTGDPTTPAADALATLPVKGRAPKTGYDRNQFGPTWADVDRNGCDTRNDILARDLDGETFKPGTRNCVVLTGALDDPYTATRIQFVRGEDTSRAVQIDHVVALSDAWQKGAQQLTADEREKLANDPLNLQATDGPTNARKGDGDFATWKPPARGYWCTYVATQIAVKAKYRLWVTQAEHDAMAEALSSCPQQTIPDR